MRARWIVDACVCGVLAGAFLMVAAQLTVLNFSTNIFSWFPGVLGGYAAARVRYHFLKSASSSKPRE